jgi:hypothetical protein
MAPTRERLNDLLHDMAEQDEHDFAAALWKQMIGVATVENVEKHNHGGSLPGNAANKTRDFAAGRRRLMLNFFWPPDVLQESGYPVYNGRL